MNETEEAPGPTWSVAQPLNTEIALNSSKSGPPLSPSKNVKENGRETASLEIASLENPQNQKENTFIENYEESPTQVAACDLTQDLAEREEEGKEKEEERNKEEKEKKDKDDGEDDDGGEEDDEVSCIPALFLPPLYSPPTLPPPRTCTFHPSIQLTPPPPSTSRSPRCPRFWKTPTKTNPHHLLSMTSLRRSSIPTTTRSVMPTQMPGAATHFHPRVITMARHNSSRGPRLLLGIPLWLFSAPLPNPGARCPSFPRCC